MANVTYPLYREALLNGDANIGIITGDLKAALVDTDVYTYSAADKFLTDLSGVVGTSVSLATKVVAGGNFDSANPTWSSVSGPEVEAVVHYIDTGIPGDSRLVAYIDDGVGGMPVTPNGGDITFDVDPAGWWRLGTT